jgi:hypothetical protein
MHRSGTWSLLARPEAKSAEKEDCEKTVPLLLSSPAFTRKRGDKEEGGSGLLKLEEDGSMKNPG